MDYYVSSLEGLLSSSGVFYKVFRIPHLPPRIPFVSARSELGIEHEIIRLGRGTSLLIDINLTSLCFSHVI
jgi:hypothetical protein